MNRTLRSIVVAAGAVLSLLAAMPPAATAQEWKPLLRMGIDFGGDKLAEGDLIYGNTTTTEQIRANQFISFAGGAQWVDASKKWYAEFSLGWKGDAINATNQQYRFYRYPLEVLGFYALPAPPWEGAVWRLGGGLTYHIHPELSASGTYANGNVRFHNELGGVVQTDILFPPGNVTQLGIGLRYTILTYEVAATGQKFSSNGLGIVFSLAF